MGADEFVMDSYVIRQGKYAILEMMGVEVEELDPDAMCEYKDVIAEDDILNIAVYHPKRKDLMESVQFINHTVGGFRVYRGKVDLPDIPPVEVAGLTLDEARERLREEFQQTDPGRRSVRRLSRPVDAQGGAHRNGSDANVPVDGKMRLYDVIANCAHTS